MYNLSTLLFRCNAPSIVIVFLHFLSIHFNSLSFHCRTPAPYLNTATAHALLLLFCFFPFNFYFRTSRSLRLYSFIVFLSFCSLCTYPIQLGPNMCIPFRPPSLFHNLGAFSFTSDYFSSLHGRNSTFFIRKSIPISLLKTLTVLKSVSICSSLLENSFKSSIDNK